MSIKKQVLKSRPECKVSFRVDAIEGVEKIESVKILGDFNNWDTSCESMKLLKSGSLTQTVSLETGKSYQFKYLVNGTIWANEPDADSFVQSSVDPNNQNSVLEL